MAEIILYIGKDSSSKKEKFLEAVSKVTSPVCGIVTEKIGTDINQPAPCYIQEYGTSPNYDHSNRIGICQYKHSVKFPETFETVGVRILGKVKPEDTIIIYEVGVMENEAFQYQNKILGFMDQADHNMILAVRDKDTDFLRKVIHHNNVTERIYCD